MIPDAQQRLEAGLTDLKALLVHFTLLIGLICRKQWMTKFLVTRNRRLRLSFKKVRQQFRDECSHDMLEEYDIQVFSSS